MSDKKINVYCPRTYPTEAGQLIRWMSKDFTIASDLNTKVDLIIFKGGVDVNPNLYGEEKIPATNMTDDNADKVDIDAYRFAIENKIPMMGICRGSQFLTVMNGGRLIQDVTGHGGNHNIKFNDDSVFDMTSTHHQMMNPFFDLIEGTDYILHAWAERPLSTKYMTAIADIKLGLEAYADKNNVIREPEIVYYKASNSLAIQGHPEYSTCGDATRDKIIGIIENTLLKTKYTVVA